ncbi:MAG TPA: hypothetical protein VFC95_05320 [Guyparkeria sp.]|nr:hypothetical protein [Guyparkeria sp.]
MATGPGAGQQRRPSAEGCLACLALVEEVGGRQFAFSDELIRFVITKAGDWLIAVDWADYDLVVVIPTMVHKPHGSSLRKP